MEKTGLELMASKAEGLLAWHADAHVHYRIGDRVCIRGGLQGYLLVVVLVVGLIGQIQHFISGLSQPTQPQAPVEPDVDAFCVDAQTEVRHILFVGRRVVEDLLGRPGRVVDQCIHTEVGKLPGYEFEFFPADFDGRLATQYQNEVIARLPVMIQVVARVAVDIDGFFEHFFFEYELEDALGYEFFGERFDGYLCKRKQIVIVSLVQ
jgi:hypothetical protein